MFDSIRIDSRAGNRCIAVAGFIYAVAALTLLGYHLATTWDAESIIDIALQIGLVLAIIGGIAFVNVGRTNLRRLRS